MKTLVFGFLAAVIATASAEAATVSRTVSTDGTSGSFGFEFGDFLAEQKSLGYGVSFTGGTLTFSGASMKVEHPKTFESSTLEVQKHWVFYPIFYYEKKVNVTNYALGDHVADTVSVFFGDQKLSDTTEFATIDRTQGTLRTGEKWVHNNYDMWGDVSSSGVLSDANLAKLNNTGQLDFSTLLEGDPFQMLDVTLNAQYVRSEVAPDISAVPLPASALVLISALGSLAALCRRRRPA